MKTLRCFAIAMCLLTLTAFAQEEEDRGLFFKLGEKIMSIGGYSYVKLENEFKASVKSHGECLVELKRKTEDLQNCSAQANSAPAPDPMETPAIAPAPTP